MNAAAPDARGTSTLRRAAAAGRSTSPGSAARSRRWSTSTAGEPRLFGGALRGLREAGAYADARVERCLRRREADLRRVPDPLLPAGDAAGDEGGDAVRRPPDELAAPDPGLRHWIDGWRRSRSPAAPPRADGGVRPPRAGPLPPRSAARRPPERSGTTAGERSRLPPVAPFPPPCIMRAAAHASTLQREEEENLTERCARRGLVGPRRRGMRAGACRGGGGARPTERRRGDRRRDDHTPGGRRLPRTTNPAPSRRFYDARRGALDALSCERLLAAEASARGVTPEKLREQVTGAAAVTDADIQAFYDQNKARMGGRPSSR